MTSPQERMLRAIRDDYRRTRAYTGRRECDPSVLAAMARVPRERFVPEAGFELAYANTARSIGHGQTISQPYIVALMTDLLDLQPGDRVLDVGTGSGYAAAVLAEMGADVFGIEIVEPLADRARALLGELGYDRVAIRCADGWNGWPEHAPFDGILVAAATPKVAPAWLEQLSGDGRIVVPLGGSAWGQMLTVVERDADGMPREQRILSVRFVPLTGGGGA